MQEKEWMDEQKGGMEQINKKWNIETNTTPCELHNNTHISKCS